MILGLDIGTTSVAGVLVTPGDREVAQSGSSCHEADVSGLPPGHHEQCPRKILEVSREILRSLAAKADSPVQAIALTGQMHGILAVDVNLKPLTNLITWRDRRTAGYPDDLRLHPYTEETGCFLHPGYGGLTLHHLLRTGALPENTHTVLSIPGFVAAHLTGRCAVESIRTT